MAFKDAFADLVNDTPAARLGSETRLSLREETQDDETQVAHR